MGGLIASLVAIVGADHVITDGDASAGYHVDWTGRYNGQSVAIVRPADVGETTAVIGLCRRHGIPVVPQGGNTGLVGGGVPSSSGDAIVLSTQRMTSIVVDHIAGQVTTGAGIVLARLQAELMTTPWEFGVDLGARGSCTVGGMIATNAGGSRVLRHGAMRAQVLGVEAVLGDGSVVSHLGGLVKDNTGYDLGALLAGSEGTLGVITAARLRLVPRPTDRVTVLASLPSATEAMALAARLRATVTDLDGIEAVFGDGIDLVCSHTGLPQPFPVRPVVTVLAEWAGLGEPPASMIEAFDGLEHIVATDAPGRRRLWRYREAMTESISREGIPHKLDVTLPFDRLADFIALVPSLTKPHRFFLFGHLGDGNVHVNVLGPETDDFSVDDRVLSAVIAAGGSISAEHGIGRAKIDKLVEQRSSHEIAAFHALKRALDPDGIMNPGVLLPSER